MESRSDACRAAMAEGSVASKANEKPPRESFGEDGIDWEVAAGEMDRLLASTSSRVTAAHSTNTTNCQGMGGMPLENKKRKVELESTSQSSNNSQVNRPKSGLTAEQRARMEENRRKALEKRQQKSQQAALSQLLKPKSTIEHTSQSTYSIDQRARMEENRQKALAKKQKMSPLPNATIQCLSPNVCNDKQRARMEENRRKALERKQQNSQQVSGLPKATIQCSSPSVCNSGPNNEQRARMEENKRKALEKKRGKAQIGPDLPPKTAVQCQSPSVCNDEQRARMEENRRKALEKKQLKSAALNSTSCLSSTYSDEQHARMEENRWKALEKRQLSKAIAPVPLPVKSTIQSTSPANKQKMSSIEKSPGKGLIMHQPVLQAASLVSKNTTNSIDMGNEQSTHNIHNHHVQTMDENQHTVTERPHQFSQSDIPSTTLASPHHALPASDVKLRDGLDDTITDLRSLETQKMASLMEEKREEQMQKISLQISSTDADMKPPAHETVAASNSATGPPDIPAPSPTKSPPKKRNALPQIPQDLQYEESRVLPIDDEHTESLIENAGLDEPLLNGWSIYDHQKEGVLRALRMRRLILAFDMGLGKTLIGCLWAKAFVKTFEGIKIFLIAPASLQEDWKRTAVEATGLRIDTSGEKKAKKGKSKKKTKKTEKKDSGKTVTGKRRKRSKTLDSDSEQEEDGDDHNDSEDEKTNDVIDLHVCTWDGISATKHLVLDTTDYIVICDEAHCMQSMTTQRTQGALKLIESKKCRGTLLLSGTPMKNGKPSNLFPLLRAVKHPFGDHQRRYEFYFCNGQHRNFRGTPKWDASGSSNLKELNAHTASHVFRRTKEECLSQELPPQKREIKTIPVSARHELRYTHALKDLAEAYSLSSSGGENDEILSSLHKLRQIGALAKVDSVAALANSILIEESSIVIFTSFVAVAKEIYEKLDGMEWAGELLTGETAKVKRQAMVDRFQSGFSPVFVCTYGAGGVGLTLTAACTVILVDRPWTPGDVCQAEDRVRRIGQRRPVRSIWIRAFPIDEQVDELISHKEVNSSTAVDGKDHGVHNRGAPKVSIAELVKSVLSRDKEEATMR